MTNGEFKMLTSEEKLKQTVQKQSTETLKKVVWALGTGEQDEAGLLAFGFASNELSKRIPSDEFVAFMGKIEEAMV